jgi:glycosyltransferase involved in cell wall biosynthesis
MKTLLLLPALFASDGGIERILRLYVRAACELTPPGGHVHALVLNDTAIPEQKLAPYATPALTTRMGFGRNKARCAWHAMRWARRSQRVICGHIHLLRLALLTRRLRPTLEIWLVAHGLEVWREFSAAEQRALVATDRILCVSDYTRRQLLARCPGLDPARLVVQPNALDPQFAMPLPDPAEAVPGLILSVARLANTESYKGIDHMIRALPAIRAAVPHAHLRVVGHGDDRPRLEKLAADNGVSPHVTFTGRVSDAELRRHFAECQLFALPSGGEGFGLVYLEAFAHGKPCLAANAGGAPEVVNAACGAVVPYGDVAAIGRACADALRRDWDSATLRARADEFSYEAFRRRLAGWWNAGGVLLPREEARTSAA